MIVSDDVIRTEVLSIRLHYTIVKSLFDYKISSIMFFFAHEYPREYTTKLKTIPLIVIGGIVQRVLFQ